MLDASLYKLPGAEARSSASSTFGPTYPNVCLMAANESFRPSCMTALIRVQEATALTFLTAIVAENFLVQHLIRLEFFLRGAICAYAMMVVVLRHGMVFREKEKHHV